MRNRIGFLAATAIMATGIAVHAQETSFYFRLHGSPGAGGASPPGAGMNSGIGGDDFSIASSGGGASSYAAGSPFDDITLVPTGGRPPVRFGVTGALPPGVSLDDVSGVISGSPRRAGTYVFGFTATDASGAVRSTADRSVTVTAPAPLASRFANALQSEVITGIPDDTTMLVSGGAPPLRLRSVGNAPAGIEA